jgi:hypothetical protein
LVLRYELSIKSMVQELHPGVIGRVSDKIICVDVLNQPEHWRE